MAGVGSYLLYGEETTFGTEASTIQTGFGLVKSFSPNENWNTIKQRGFVGTSSGGRESAFQVKGKFESGFSVDLEPQHFNWMKYVLGTVSGTGTSGDPFIYTKGNAVTSLTVVNDIDNDTDREEKYLGSVINSMTVRAAIGESVSVSLDFVNADVSKDTGLQSKVALDSNDGYTFIGGSIEIPNTSVIPNVIDSAELTITANAEIKHGVGSAVGQFFIVKALDYSLKFTVNYVDDTLYDLFVAGAEVATLGLRFANGTNYIDFVFTGAFPSNLAETNNLNEAIMEEYTFDCRSLTATEVHE